jgi:hypothetical protein
MGVDILLPAMSRGAREADLGRGDGHLDQLVVVLVPHSRVLSCPAYLVEGAVEVAVRQSLLSDLGLG